MFNRFKVFASYLFAIPLALILGFLVASPDEMTLMLLGVFFFCLSLPVLLRWHHFLLIASWNAVLGFFFLSSQPPFWLMLAFFSFGLTALEFILTRKQLLHVPEMTRPLLAFGCMVLIIMVYHGGIGLKSLGGESQGGKFYLFILGAILGYFALSSIRSSTGGGRWMVALYFGTGLTSALSNLAYVLGPTFYFMYYLVPAGTAYTQAASDLGLTNVDRIQGLAPACEAALCLLLLAYGMRGILDWLRPWRIVMVLLVFAVSLFGGFRSVLMVMVLLCICQFWFEGLHRTRLVLIVAGVVAVVAVGIVVWSNKLPFSVQRALSFLPLKLESAATDDALASTEWRLQMWRVVWHEIPHYWLVGKGYAIDGSEMYLTKEGIRLGILPSYEEPLLAGDYHSGPLSVLVPFGIFGVLLVGWVFVAGCKVLWFNYKYGEPIRQRINTLLLSFYVANLIAFFFIFGSLYSQLWLFLGAVGISVSLNGGMARNSGGKESFARRERSRNQFAIENKLG